MTAFVLLLAPFAPAAGAQSGDTAAPYPTSDDLDAARRFAADRRGLVSFAVIDTEGRLRGEQVNRQFVTASVVKAMLLVAYLDKLSRNRKPVTQAARRYLDPMIRVSDNHAATVIYRRVGNRGLYRVARRSGTTRFWVCCSWARAQITAADQARFFIRFDELTPSRYRSYARRLLSTVIPRQAWGIPSVARPRYTVFWKVGFRHTLRGVLVHQASLLEGRGRRFSMVVLTDGDPSFGYGVATIRGVAARLLATP